MDYNLTALENRSELLVKKNEKSQREIQEARKEGDTGKYRGPTRIIRISGAMR